MKRNNTFAEKKIENKVVVIIYNERHEKYTSEIFANLCVIFLCSVSVKAVLFSSRDLNLRAYVGTILQFMVISYGVCGLICVCVLFFCSLLNDTSEQATR